MYSRFHIKIVLFLVSFSFSFLVLFTLIHIRTQKNTYIRCCVLTTQGLYWCFCWLLLPISIRASRYTLCLWHCARFAFKAKSQKKLHRNCVLCCVWVQCVSAEHSHTYRYALAQTHPSIRSVIHFGYSESTYIEHSLDQSQPQRHRHHILIHCAEQYYSILFFFSRVAEIHTHAHSFPLYSSTIDRLWAISVRVIMKMKISMRVRWC